MRLQLEVVNYSEKAIAMFGDTKEVSASLKVLGGRYNRHLTHPATKQKAAGWIFSAKKKDKVQAFVFEATNN